VKLRFLAAVLFISGLAQGQTSTASVELKYHLASGDRLVFRERIHREVSSKDLSSISEGEWLTQVLVLAEGNNFVVGTQRNRTRAEMLQYRISGKDQIAQGRTDFEAALQGRGPAFSAASVVNALGAPLLPPVAAREWFSLMLLDVHELMAMPEAPVKIGDTWTNNDVLGLTFRAEKLEDVNNEQCLRVAGENLKNSRHMQYWFCPASGEMRKLEFDARYPLFENSVHEVISLELLERHSGEDASKWIGSPETQSALLAMLVLPGSKLPIPEGLERLSESSDPHVQRKALAVLYQRHSSVSAELISKSLKSPDPRVRVLAVRLLQNVPPESAKPLLQQANNDADYFVRNAAQHLKVTQPAEQQLAATADCAEPVNQRRITPGLGVATLQGMTTAAFAGWPYVLYVPEDYRGDREFPVVIYLGGGGGNALLTAIQNRDTADQLGYIFVYPQARGNWWEKDSVAIVHSLLEEILKSYNVDTNRVYLTGFSNGGTGAFYDATLWPDRFAAVVSLMGAGVQFPGPDPPLPISTINLPLLFLHGEKDPLIPVDASRRTVEELKKLPREAEVELYTFKDKQHELDLEHDEGRTVKFFEQHVRHPYPRQIMLQMRNLDYSRQYWIQVAEKTAGIAELRGEIGDDNTIRLKSKNITRVRLLLRRELLNGELKVLWNGKEVYSGTAGADCALLQHSAAESGDPDLAYSFELTLTAP
jgi:pimeloyl-ACP methyl ester carboxylesterase